MISHGKDIKVFSGNANPKLAEEICKLMGTKLGEAEVGTFSDGEIFVSLYETVRGSDVFVVQSTCTPVTTAMPGRTARPRPVTPSPPSWWPTCSPPRARTGC